MCWNKEISLNTFIFSAGTLAFILYNNKYTQYRIPFFDNKYVVLFFILVIIVQLIEYFLWVSINTKNKSKNEFWSIILFIVTILQPFVALMWVTNTNVRNILITIFIAIYAISFAIIPLNFETVKHKSGHLQWNAFSYRHELTMTCFINYIRSIIWFVSFFTGFYYLLDFPYFLIILTITILFMIYHYNSNQLNVFNSNWCWFTNGFSLIFAFYLLFVLPYREYQQIC